MVVAQGPILTPDLKDLKVWCMENTTSIGIEQARADLGGLVLKAERCADLNEAITIISRYGRDVAAIVPAGVAGGALDDEAEPHPVVVYRIALTVHNWRESHRGTAVHDLPERELGRALGFAESLLAAMQRESGSDIYPAPHPVAADPGGLAWVAEMLDIADGIVADWTAWIQSSIEAG